MKYKTVACYDGYQHERTHATLAEAARHIAHDWRRVQVLGGGAVRTPYGPYILYRLSNDQCPGNQRWSGHTWDWVSTPSLRRLQRAMGGRTCTST